MRTMFRIGLMLTPVVLALAATSTPANAEARPAVPTGSSVSAVAPASANSPNVSVMPAKGVTTTVVTPFDTTTCTSLSNGLLCARILNSRTTVTVWYYKTGGATISARLGWDASGVDHWDAGSFTETKGQTKTYAWNNLNLGCTSIVGFLVVSGQGRFQTPSISDC